VILGFLGIGKSVADDGALLQHSYHSVPQSRCCGLPTADVNASFSDIFDHLDFGAIAIGEARCGRYSKSNRLWQIWPFNQRSISVTSGREKLY
jgi:hypothetical protein